MMDRRRFLLTSLAGVLAAPRAAAAQPSRVPRLCFLALYPDSERPALYRGFIEGLHELGYDPGRNVAIEYLSADGRFDRFPALAADCVALKADVIVVQTTPGALAAKKATRTIPIVSGSSGDPVATGLVDSLARPGGNVTGLSNLGPGLSAKRLELLREVVPAISRATVLANGGDVIAAAQIKEIERAAHLLGIKLRVRDVRTSRELPAAFASASRDGDEGLLTTIESLFATHRTQVVELAGRHRLPAVYPFREFVESGGLLSYGPDIGSLYRRAAAYVDKILKGAKPGDLPVEQPTKFELVINLKTAKALGLTIPPSLLARADQVIE